MHELGIVYEVVRIVDDFVKENDLKEVEKIVLEVGQLSQAIPRFLEECFPAAVCDTPYEKTRLEIEVIKAQGKCKICNTIYNIVDHRRVCPCCQNTDYFVISGQEFNIKEIVAY